MIILDAPQPDIRPISKGQYKLYEDYYYSYKLGDKTTYGGIPKGFIYDGASVPRILWSVLGMSPDGLGRPAFLIHDFMYDKQKKSRKFADDLFYEVLLYVGESRWRAWTAYKGVRLFGGRVWRE